MILSKNIDAMLKDPKTSQEALLLTDIFAEIFEKSIEFDLGVSMNKDMVSKAKNNLIKLNELAKLNSMPVVYIDNGRDGADIFKHIVYQFRKDIHIRNEMYRANV